MSVGGRGHDNVEISNSSNDGGKEIAENKNRRRQAKKNQSTTTAVSVDADAVAIAVAEVAATSQM